MAGVSLTGRPGTSMRMLNLRRCRSPSSAGGVGGGNAGGERETESERHVKYLYIKKKKKRYVWNGILAATSGKKKVVCSMCTAQNTESNNAIHSIRPSFPVSQINRKKSLLQLFTAISS